LPCSQHSKDEISLEVTSEKRKNGRGGGPYEGRNWKNESPQYKDYIRDEMGGRKEQDDWEKEKRSMRPEKSRN